MVVDGGGGWNRKEGRKSGEEGVTLGKIVL